LNIPLPVDVTPFGDSPTSERLRCSKYYQSQSSVSYQFKSTPLNLNQA
jgi:hypothetical protein